MTFLVDYNLDGYALIFLGILAKRGWIEFQSVEFVTFREAGLSMESSDRVVWHYAQEHEMIILTANRNMKGKDSLEQVMRFPSASISGGFNSLREPLLSMLPERLLRQQTWPRTGNAQILLKGGSRFQRKRLSPRERPGGRRVDTQQIVASDV